jgi:hypothetical protein
MRRARLCWTFLVVTLRFGRATRRPYSLRFGAFCAEIDLDSFVARLARCTNLASIEVGCGKVKRSIPRWHGLGVRVFASRFILRRRRLSLLSSAFRASRTLWGIPSRRLRRIRLVVRARVFHEDGSTLALPHWFSWLDAFDDQRSSSREVMNRPIRWGQVPRSWVE